MRGGEKDQLKSGDERGGGKGEMGRGGLWIKARERVRERGGGFHH